MDGLVSQWVSVGCRLHEVEVSFLIINYTSVLYMYAMDGRTAGKKNRVHTLKRHVV